MRSLKRKLFVRIVGGSILLIFLMANETFISFGQNASQPLPTGQSPTAGQGRVSVGPDEDADNPMMHRAAAEAQKKRNAQRQEQIVKDTARLAELAQQLKEEVAKSDKNTLSLAVVRKAEEIEKLAKSVKDKMKAE